MDCSAIVELNLEGCTCTYEPCSRKGQCCKCVQYHRQMEELPGCFFPPEVERTYDRSYRCFSKTVIDQQSSVKN